MGKWLQNIRKEKRMTQQQVAGEVGITRAYYTQIENGKRRPSVDVAKKLAGLLDFDWTCFFAENPEIYEESLGG